MRASVKGGPHLCSAHSPGGLTASGAKTEEESLRWRSGPGTPQDSRALLRFLERDRARLRVLPAVHHDGVRGARPRLVAFRFERLGEPEVRVHVLDRTRKFPLVDEPQD